MPKARPFSERAVAAARRVLDDAGVRAPEPIDVEAIAAKHGALAVYGPMRTARAMIVRRGRDAIIQVDERMRGRRAARFTIAHELMHHLLHTHADHFRQCVTDHAVRDDGEYEIEQEANDGGTELLVPEHLGAPFCAGEEATVEAVDRLARTFATSFEMSAIRMTELTMAPCAVVASENGRVKWAVESLTFPGTVRRGQRVHRASVAARVARGTRADREETVEGTAWKSREALTERAWRLGAGKVISWVMGAAMACALLGTGCIEHVSVTRRFTPGPPTKTVSVLGFYEDGDMVDDRALAARLGGPSARCEAGYGADLLAHHASLSKAIGDFAKVNGPNDDLLARLAPAARGDTILVVVLSRQPYRARVNGSLDLASPLAAGVSAAAGGGALALGGFSESELRIEHDTTLQAEALLYSVAERRWIGTVSVSYAGKHAPHALSRFSEELRRALEGATCGDWDWSAPVDTGALGALTRAP